MQVTYMEELARLARDLGTNMVRIFTAYERKGLGIPYDRQYAMVVEALKLGGERAARYGVTFCVQNHHDIALHHDAMYWLLKEVNHPNVKAGWDAWSPNLEGLSPEEIRQGVLKMKPYIINTIAADYVKLPRYSYENHLTNYMAETPVMRACAMGEGMIDYKTFFSALKEIGYQGYIVYEMCEVLDGGGSIQNLDKTARKFLEYMKQW
jgi:sugar phosphate isomerase/epimerase